jgi:hypothetical protein
MKFRVYCHWADGCAGERADINASTTDELLKMIEETFRKACGAIGGVESFSVVCCDRDIRDDDYEYDWNNDNLRRSEDLADVWGEVRLEIKEFFKETFNENQK